PAGSLWDSWIARRIADCEPRRAMSNPRRSMMASYSLMLLLVMISPSSAISRLRKTGTGGDGNMAKLIGAQRMVLQAIVDLSPNSVGFVTDSQIAQATQIAIADVRDWIETLEGEGLVNVAKITSGLSASITAQGRLALGLYRPIAPSPSPNPPQPAT